MNTKNKDRTIFFEVHDSILKLQAWGFAVGIGPTMLGEKEPWTKLDRWFFVQRYISRRSHQPCWQARVLWFYFGVTSK